MLSRVNRRFLHCRGFISTVLDGPTNRLFAVQFSSDSDKSSSSEPTSQDSKSNKSKADVNKQNKQNGDSSTWVSLHVNESAKARKVNQSVTTKKNLDEISDLVSFENQPASELESVAAVQSKRKARQKVKKTKPSDLDPMKEAAYRVAAQAGEAQEVVVEQLLNTVSKTQRNSSKSPRSSQSNRSDLEEKMQEIHKYLSGEGVSSTQKSKHVEKINELDEVLGQHQKSQKKSKRAEKVLDEFEELGSFDVHQERRKRPQHEFEKRTARSDRSRLNSLDDVGDAPVRQADIKINLNDVRQVSIEKMKTLDDMLNQKHGNLLVPVKDQRERRPSVMETWNKLADRDNSLAVSHFPSNWWDECIQWTKEGKLWHFPINNEQGMDQEAEVYFTEHIFLDEHIEDWCPKEGPIRHFMEIVLVGLSKNPHLSVQEKVDYINWFRDYFEKNRTLLQEINAFGSDSGNSALKTKVSL